MNEPQRIERSFEEYASTVRKAKGILGSRLQPVIGQRLIGCVVSRPGEVELVFEGEKSNLVTMYLRYYDGVLVGFVADPEEYVR